MNDIKTINYLKGLVIDGVNQANSGHPGGALSSMDFAYILYTEYLKFDPEDAQWLGRDRFILSAGHESMLLYSLLHYIGWLPIDELKNFRQLVSKTPGHPENTMTPGVECTTGPLGQGAAMSVGFAMGSNHFGQRLDQDLFSQNIYALLGDGCMQEGVTFGAASMAGHLKLSNLIWYYDRNRIQISGEIDRSVSDDPEKIFEGFGWKVKTIDGHNHDQIRQALDEATKQSEAPFLIIGDTQIANGVHSMAGLAKTHGAPLPADERLKTKEKMEISEDFATSDDTLNHFRRNFGKLKDAANSWRSRLAQLRQESPEFDTLFQQCFESKTVGQLPKIDWPREKPMATRVAFGKIIAQWADAVPNLIGGSADLEPSNMTGEFAKKVGDYQAETPGNRNIAFGVREFPMSAVCNGLALYGGLIPFDATFLTFADYSRPALRLGAIQKTKVIHELTHDSFYLGEDGPTHQPVEHLMALRLIPGFYLFRPADSQETEILMESALNLQANSAFCLSRQGLPFLDQDHAVLQNAKRGAYIIKEAKDPEIVIFASGSEVHLALKTAEQLAPKAIQVVSVPCWELFQDQPEDYRQSVLAPQCQKRVSIEAGSTLGWERFTGFDGINIGRDNFGESAPYQVLEKEYGFTPEACAKKITQKWFT